jgi:PAS domain S-box-containing protein
MYRWAIAAIFLVLAVGIVLYDNAQQARHKAYQNAEALKDLSTLRANLEGTVNSTLQLTQGLVAYVATHPDLTREAFEAIARELMVRSPHIRNMTLVRGERIIYVYPYEGNEAALGLNIFAHPEQKQTAQRVRESGETVVGGPYELIQGGRALVSRTPIFIAQGRENAGSYWGMSSIPLDLKSIYQAAGIDPDNPRLAIRGADALGAKGATFLGDPAVFEAQEAVKMTVALPGGSWQMALRPRPLAIGPRLLRLGGAGFLVLVFVVMMRQLITSRQRLQQLNSDLAKSESSYRMIASHLGEAVFKTDRHGALRYISPAATKIFGLPDLEGALWVTLFDGGDQKRARALFETALATPGSEQSATFRVRLSDRIRWIEVHARALDAREGEAGLVGTMRDETKRIQAQQALTRSRDELAESQRIARLGSWEIDLKSRVLTLSPGHRRLMGESTGELPMTILLEHFLTLYVHPEDATVFKAAIDRAEAGGCDRHYRDNFEYRLKTVDKRQLAIWAHLRPREDDARFFVGVSQDISPLKEMQQALLDSQVRYRGFIENLSDGVLVIQQGVVRYTNEAMAQMVGYSVDELIGSELERCVVADDRPRLQHYHAARLQGKPAPESYELRVVRRDGAIRTVQVRASLTPWDSQPAVIATVSDISEQKAYEKLLILQKEQHEKLLIQQSKMAAMGEMVAAIIHQFRQPLTVLSLIVQEMEELSQEGALDAAFIHQVKTQASEQISYMQRTSEDFQNFFRPDKEQGRFSPLQAVREVEALLKRQLKAAHTALLYDASNDPCEVSGVYNEFKQVILNLLSNARDAIIRARRAGELAASEAGVITVRVHKEAQQVTLRICDNGGGIEPPLINRIFEPYFTTKDESEGTGIGLYMSKTIIESAFSGTLTAHNGTKGACFTITLPL